MQVTRQISGNDTKWKNSVYSSIFL